MPGGTVFHGGSAPEPLRRKATWALACFFSAWWHRFHGYIWKSVLFDLHFSWKSAIFTPKKLWKSALCSYWLPDTCASANQINHLTHIDLEGLVLNKTIIVSSRHYTLTTCFVRLIISTTKEWIRSFLARLDNEIPITTAVSFPENS